MVSMCVDANLINLSIADDDRVLQRAIFNCSRESIIDFSK